MVDFLEDHHETYADDVVIELFTIFVAAMTEMAQGLADLELDLCLKICHILCGQAAYPLFLQIFLEDIVGLLHLLDYSV